MEISLLVDRFDPGIICMALGRSRQIRQPFILQDFQPNVGLSVHVTEMGVQWLMCKLPVFVFIICGGDSRRKGRGRCKAASWNQHMQNSSHWNCNGKKAEEKGLEGMLPLELCCLCPVREAQALKQCFSFLQTFSAKKRHEIKGNRGADTSLVAVSTPEQCSAVGGCS